MAQSFMVNRSLLQTSLLTRLFSFLRLLLVTRYDSHAPQELRSMSIHFLFLAATNVCFAILITVITISLSSNVEMTQTHTHTHTHTARCECTPRSSWLVLVRVRQLLIWPLPRYGQFGLRSSPLLQNMCLSCFFLSHFKLKFLKGRVLS